ncbi:MAG: AAA family ATPase [Chitinophagales bacterium]
MKPSFKQTISDMCLFDNAGIYINGKRLFYSYFNQVPCVISISDIQDNKVKEFIETSHKDKIAFYHQKRKLNTNNRPLKYENIIFCMTDNVFIDVENDAVTILYDITKEAAAENWTNELRTFIKKRSKKIIREIGLVAQSRNGLCTYNIEFKKPKLDLCKHYNDDIIDMHKTVLNNIRKKNKSGVILFHGAPGTGKSTYIKHLIYQQRKQVVFLPPSLAANLDSPSFTDLLLRYQNAIFVIEDAEQLITSRDINSNSQISMLLNLTDGLLGESLGIQIIATFNTHISNIDKALLRKGRLIASYEFKALAINKAKLLAEELGNTTEIRQAMTLADIYNTEQTAFSETTYKRNTIGFANFN